MLPGEMRADMTMGLDLKSLENLRIFNGYETEKKERRLSFEAPSSPDDNNNNDESDTGLLEVKSARGKSRGKLKCGRPANPIPRHKRDSHIKAEYKRRDKIQKGFDTLLTLVPELNGVSEKESKAKMLYKTADYCRRLKSECGSTQTELTALRQELETIGTEIQNLQDKLPKHGVETVKRTEDVSMDTLYDQYVQEETKKNWKFWIFGFFMRPLYDSFKAVTSGRNERHEFNSIVFDWVQNNLSLTNLRKGFLNALRIISKQTSIMTNPEQLQNEARSKVSELCINVKKEAGSFALTPPTTPKPGTPAPGSSATCTPAHTPSPTPPRTPTVSRRSSKREIQRSAESRSRSNSPATEETKPKRRSNYRSRSGRRSEEVQADMECVSTVANPNLPLLSKLLTSPQAVQTSLFNVVTMTTASRISQENRKTGQQNTTKASEKIEVMNTSEEELVTSFVESLISSLNSKSEPVSPFTTVQSSSLFISPPVSSSVSSSEIGTHSQTQYSSTGIEALKMEVQDNIASSGFIPLRTSGIISNGSLIFQDDQFASELNPASIQFETDKISDFQPMDLLVSESSSGTISSDLSPPCNIDTLQTSMQTSTGIFTSESTNQVLPGTVYIDSTENSQVSTDEDSLMGQLSLDVMDIKSVMNFFNDDKSTLS